MKLAALVLLLLAAACSRPSEPGGVDGQVTWHGKAIPGALVEAYTRPERDPATPPAGEAASGEDGSFRLELPEGRYWIWARATLAGTERETRLAGQAAQNPVAVVGGKRSRAEISLADATGFLRAAGPEGAGARGRVAGAPFGKVTVYAYPGHHDRPTGPRFAAGVTPEDDGSFRIHLTPGPYTLAARWRASGRDFGGLSPGDRVSETWVEVLSEKYVDVGELALRTVDPTVLETLATRPPKTDTAVVGRIVDSNGRPAAGIRVLGFTDPRMAGKPLALSAPTGLDGAFRLDLPGGERYFLGARSRLGGPAEPGEKVGTYRGEDGAGVHVQAGEAIDDLEIVVEEVW